MLNAIAHAPTDQRERIVKAAVTAVYDRYCSTAIAELESAVVALIGTPIDSEDDEDAPPSPKTRAVGSVPCPCTLIEQDEDCPVGYPSTICGICKGKGHTTPDQVTALACEMIKIASDVGEPDDPFAAWESIDLVKSQNGQLRKALGKIANMLDDEDADLDHAIAISATALATTEGSDNG